MMKSEDGLLSRWFIAAVLGAFMLGLIAQAAVGKALVRAARRATGQPAPIASGRPAGIPGEFYGNLSLFVLAGQSNMSGRGELPSRQEHHPSVVMFGNDYRWRPAVEPVDDAIDQVDRVSRDVAPDAARFGPSMSFATSLASQRPELTIGLVPCAKGDTTIAEWQRSMSDSTLYGSCLKRVRAASVAGRVSGLLFFQGEADALDAERYSRRPLAPSEYAARFISVVEAFRADVGALRLPVVFAQIGTHAAPTSFTQWELVRQQQEQVDVHCTAMIRTDDLALADSVHFTTQGYRAIGERFAAAYVSILDRAACRQ